MLMMLPFEAPTIFEGIHKSYFRMPRVVKDQRNKFENDDLLRQLSHESAVKYTGFKDRPLEERQMKFITNYQEGHTEVSVVQSGIQFTLMFNPTVNLNCEDGKVHIKSCFIFNGVCVVWRGWIDINRLEGFGCLEFDEYNAFIEDTMLKQINHHHQQQQQHHQTTTPTPTLTGGAPHLAPGALGIPPPPPSLLGLNPAAHCLAQHLPQQQLPGLQQQRPGLQQQPQQQQQQQQIPGLQQQQPPPPPPPVSFADTASHYGNVTKLSSPYNASNNWPTQIPMPMALLNNKQQTYLKPNKTRMSPPAH